jgi:PAS domain S-box-containing protein
MTKRKNSMRAETIAAYALVGFIAGAMMVAIATVIVLTVEGMLFSVANVIQVHLENPLLWLMDLLPIVGAFIMGVLGAREGQLEDLRYRYTRNVQLHAEDVKRLTQKADELEQQRLELKGQIQELGSATQLQSEDLRRSQDEMATLGQKTRATEQIISRAKRQWEATFDSVQDIILLTNANETILRCNRAATEAFQKGYNELIGRPVADFVHSANSLLGPSALAAQRMEIEVPGLTGWYEVSYSSLEIEGDWAGRIYILRDVSGRRQAVERLKMDKEYLEALVKNNPQAIVKLNTDQTILDCNPAFESLFGFSRQEALGKSLDELITPSELEYETRLSEAALGRGEQVHLFTKRQTGNGQSLDVEALFIPVSLGDRQIGRLALFSSSGEATPEPELEEIAEENSPSEEQVQTEPEALALEELQAAQVEEPAANEFPEAHSEADQAGATGSPSDPASLTASSEIATPAGETAFVPELAGPPTASPPETPMEAPETHPDQDGFPASASVETPPELTYSSRQDGTPAEQSGSSLPSVQNRKDLHPREPAILHPALSELNGQTSSLSASPTQE